MTIPGFQGFDRQMGLESGIIFTILFHSGKSDVPEIVHLDAFPFV
jgi:hypothetical protein